MARLTRAEQQARTRDALVDAAAEVFVERGFQGASVESIAERAGFTRGAFYSNFESKEHLFAELLQRRVYDIYARMATDAITGERVDSPRESGARLAAVQAHPDGRWLFRLWLELLAQAGRDEKLRALAAGFWSTNRDLIARALDAELARRGTESVIDTRTLASAAIALDIGLAIQHYVDPDAVPLDVYPDAFEQLYRGVD